MNLYYQVLHLHLNLNHNHVADRTEATWNMICCVLIMLFCGLEHVHLVPFLFIVGYMTVSDCVCVKKGSMFLGNKSMWAYFSLSLCKTEKQNKTQHMSSKINFNKGILTTTLSWYNLVRLRDNTTSSENAAMHKTAASPQAAHRADGCWSMTDYPQTGLHI